LPTTTSYAAHPFTSILIPQEEVYEVIEGELEMALDGVTQVVWPGLIAIVPGGVRHSVTAITDGRVVIVDYPSRPGIVPAGRPDANALSVVEQERAG
jgi:ethanolamine utilization protein EutQ (cupin superfamily)